MRLLVISHTRHYQHREQRVGWGPTVRELDFLAKRFDELVHLAVLHPGAAPGGSLAYTAENIRLVLLPPAGGPSLLDKVGIIRKAPLYLGEIRRQLRSADAVQVRCPASISLLALLALIASPKPPYRWFKYAGNWQPGAGGQSGAGGEALSYRLQRWLLAQNWARGPVTVNGRWPDQPGHIYSLDNPCLAQAEIETARNAIIEKRLDRPLVFLFVGRTEGAKGLGEALQIVAGLKARGLAVHFDVIGGGAEQAHFQSQAAGLGIAGQTRFHGFLPRHALPPYYMRAHYLLLPSHSSEGWPKAIGEAMAYGVVPLASAVSSIPQILSEIGCGVAVPEPNAGRYIAEILAYQAHPTRWLEESQRGRQAAHRFTYEAYGASLDRIFRQAWGVALAG